MSGGTPDDESEAADQPEDVEDRRLKAAQLRAVLNREDEHVHNACRESKDLKAWLDEYYHGNFMRELFAVAPGCCVDYCDARCKLWGKFFDHVKDQKKLGELVKAQKQTVGERVAGLLTEELTCPA